MTKSVAVPNFRSGTVDSVTAGWDWSEIEVYISGAADEDVFTISFDVEDQYDFSTYVEACWPLLIGDVDGDLDVDSADAAAIVNLDGVTVGKTTFHHDLDHDKSIEGATPNTDDLDIGTAHHPLLTLSHVVPDAPSFRFALLSRNGEQDYPMPQQTPATTRRRGQAPAVRPLERPFPDFFGNYHLPARPKGEKNDRPSQTPRKARNPILNLQKNRPLIPPPLRPGTWGPSPPLGA